MAIGYALAVLIEWGLSVYFWFAEGKLCISENSTCSTDVASSAVLIWRLYALYNRSKWLLYVLLATFLPIVALEIGTDIYLYSRRSAFSGEF
jgi:hypothetical protein